MHQNLFYLTNRNSSLRGSFGDSVSEVDATVGWLLSVLRDTGSAEDTLVILTSDNGPRLQDQGRHQAGDAGGFRCGKDTTWEGGRRTSYSIC